MLKSIVIVDDHVLIAKALTSIIEDFRSYTVLYECENGEVLQAKFKNSNNIPHIVLLDIGMPKMDGFDTAAWLKKEYPEILIMVLSMQDDEHSLVKMIRNGARGYLLKNVHPADFEKALDILVETGFYYPGWATQYVFKNLNEASSAISKSIELNDREKAFLQFSISEMSYKEIAEKMYCSPRTVESYRDNLFEKFGLRTRVGLVIYAIRHKLVEL